MDEVQDFITRELFELSGTIVTVASLIFFAVVLVAAWLIARIVGGFVSRWLGRLAVDEGIRFALVKGVRYAIFAAGFVLAFQIIGIDFGRLGLVLGFLSVGIGFGLQNITSNFISGLILLIERPVKVGDRVTVGGTDGDTEGDILAINLRSTVVRSLQNVSIIIPNSQLIENSVINWSHGDPRIRLEVPVGVSYGSDLETVVGALMRAAEGHPQVLSDPAPHVRLSEFGDSSWNMVLLCWLADPKSYRDIRSAVNMRIVQEFRDADVEIPFPQRDLHVRTPAPSLSALERQAD